MKYEVINKRFTEVVADYISKGYAINTATMNGMQDEKCKVDLTDGKEIVRVMLKYTYSRIDGQYFEIIAGTVNKRDKVKPHDHDNLFSIWNQYLTVTYTERFYEIAKGWYGTKEEYDRAQDKHYHRNMARSGVGYTGHYFDGYEASEIVLDFVRSQKGCKRAKPMDITVAHLVDNDRSRYVVQYKDRAFVLRHAV